MRKELIEIKSENKEETKDIFAEQKKIKTEVLKIAGNNEKLKNSLDALFPSEMEDRNFINMIAVKIHSEVINGMMDESEAKEIFGKITEKVDEYNNFLERNVEYNDLGGDYLYLKRE